MLQITNFYSRSRNTMVMKISSKMYSQQQTVWIRYVFKRGELKSIKLYSCGGNVTVALSFDKPLNLSILRCLRKPKQMQGISYKCHQWQRQLKLRQQLRHIMKLETKYIIRGHPFNLVFYYVLTVCMLEKYKPGVGEIWYIT